MERIFDTVGLAMTFLQLFAQIVMSLIVWIPTVIAWVLFVVFFKILNTLSPSPIVWRWRGVEARVMNDV